MCCDCCCRFSFIFSSNNLPLIRFLERNLDQLWDPYEMAITTYALNTVGSTEKEVALKILEAMAKRSAGKEGYLV